MKKVVFVVFLAAFFTACTETYLENDQEIITEIDTQLIDKQDSTTPNSNGGEEVDNDEE